jgi:pimeloyl-ACP methyl ester carboxylesterase
MRLAPELVRHGRVIVPDLPGFGGTPALPERTTIESLGAALDRLLDAVAPGPVTLGGNSLGGVLALRAAARRPARVERLVLFAPAVPHAWFEPFDLDLFFTMGAAMLPGIGPASVQARPSMLGPERLVDEMMVTTTYDRRRIPRHVVEAHVEAARARLGRPSVGAAFTDTLRSLSWLLFDRAQFAAIVRSVAAPTLVFAGERDRYVAARSVREACALNPRFVLRSWPDVGHVPHLEVPERVVPEIARFFACYPTAAA